MRHQLAGRPVNRYNTINRMTNQGGALYQRTRTSFYLAVLGLFLLLQSASSQVGISICGCQPATYELTIDFALTCEDGNITEASPGIERSDCQVTGEDGTPLFGMESTPIVLSLVQILELDQQLQVLVQTDYTSNSSGLISGNVLTYTSILATAPDDLDADTLPRGFQINTEGQNVFGEFIRGNFIVEYSNSCGIFPLLTPNQQDLYFRFVSK